MGALTARNLKVFFRDRVGVVIVAAEFSCPEIDGMICPWLPERMSVVAEGKCPQKRRMVCRIAFDF